VVLSAARVEATFRDHARRTGRAPTPRERRALVERAVDREILVREALDLRLDVGDPVVERRLIQNVRFLDGREASDARRLQEARALGMVEGDLVARRRLVQRMEQRLSATAHAGEPSEEALEAHRLEQAARFTNAARVRISHVFLAARGADDGAHGRALRLRERLRAQRIGPERAGEFGDAFLAAPALSQRSEAELAKLFGPELAALAMELEPGGWSAPLPSPHGQHLVWLHERVEPELPPLDAIRERVRHSLLDERAAGALTEALVRLRERYTVRVEGSAASARRPADGA
jgi:hypothetical protein